MWLPSCIDGVALSSCEQGGSGLQVVQIYGFCHGLLRLLFSAVLSSDVGSPPLVCTGTTLISARNSSRLEPDMEARGEFGNTPLIVACGSGASTSVSPGRRNCWVFSSSSTVSVSFAGAGTQPKPQISGTLPFAGSPPSQKWGFYADIQHLPEFCSGDSE